MLNLSVRRVARYRSMLLTLVTILPPYHLTSSTLQEAQQTFKSRPIRPHSVFDLASRCRRLPIEYFDQHKIGSLQTKSVFT